MIHFLYQSFTRFLLLVLRLAPAWLWWALAGLVFAVLNVAFERELWPHTPQAIPWLLPMGVGCFVVAMWAAVRILWRLSNLVANSFWHSISYVFWVSSMIAAILITLSVAFIFCLIYISSDSLVIQD